MNTCKSVSKQKTLTTFGINTCEKPQGEGGYPRPLHDIYPATMLPLRGAQSRLPPTLVFREQPPAFFDSSIRSRDIPKSR